MKKKTKKSSLEAEPEKEPILDFRRDIAEELSRDELINRLCEMQKHYIEMRKEWFAVCQLGEKPFNRCESELEAEQPKDGAEDSQKPEMTT